MVPLSCAQPLMIIKKLSRVFPWPRYLVSRQRSRRSPQPGIAKGYLDKVAAQWY